MLLELLAGAGPVFTSHVLPHLALQDGGQAAVSDRPGFAACSLHERLRTELCCRCSCQMLQHWVLSLPDASLHAAARHTLPAQHPLFRSETAPLAYLWRSQQCHASIQHPTDSWRIQGSQLPTSDDTCCPDLDVIASFSSTRRRLIVHKIADGSTLGTWTLPLRCTALERGSFSGVSVIAWQPDGRGLAVLARQAKAAQLLVLRAAWPALLTKHTGWKETVVASEEVNVAAQAALCIVWAPCATRLALVPSKHGKLHNLCREDVTSLNFGWGRETWSWQWSPDSSILAAQIERGVLLIWARTGAVVEQFVGRATHDFIWAPGEYSVMLRPSTMELKLLYCRQGVVEDPIVILPADCNGRKHRLVSGLTMFARQGHDASELQLFRLQNRQLVHVRTLEHAPRAEHGKRLAFSPDERHLALAHDVTGEDGEVCAWSLCILDVASAAMVAEAFLAVPTAENMFGISWSRDGSRLMAHSVTRYCVLLSFV